MRGFILGFGLMFILYLLIQINEVPINNTISNLESGITYQNYDNSNLELLPLNPINSGDPNSETYIDISSLNLEQHRYFDNGVEIVDRCGAYDLSSVDGQSQCQTHLLFIDTYKDAPVIPTEERIILDYK